MLDIDKIISDTCKKCASEELIERIAWSFKPIHTKLGQATFFRKLNLGSIHFNSLIWERASEKDQYETIIHEVCHIIAPYKFGYIKPHGKEWSLLMKLNNIEPIKCHNIDVSDLIKKRRKEGMCNCGIRQISTIIYNRINSGKNYICQKCMSRIYVNN